MEERLKELGDPSGKQTSEYWNEWFRVVSGEDHKPFEWYCDVEEVARVLRWHTKTTSTTRSASENYGNKPRMIHPGSGNSLVPVKLRDQFDFPHHHTVVDISNVALQAMKTIHDRTKTIPTSNNKKLVRNDDEKNIESEVVLLNEIDYILGNVLEPPLPVDDSIFDVWVDKGLVDALFKDASELYMVQSQTLFSEAFRLLKHDSGILMVVSMIEEHSLKLILCNFWEKIKDKSASLHVWELDPISGDMRPFGFVLHLHTTMDDVNSSMPDIYWHETCDDNAVTSEIRIDDRNFEALYVEAFKQCEESRLRFREERRNQNQDQTLATIEIKPWDAETDMEKLKEIIVSRRWIVQTIEGVERTLEPQWCMSDSKVVPIGYGVFKLVLQCVLNTDDIDGLVHAIGEWDGDETFSDGVQSVDVDWSQTHKIVSLAEMAFPQLM